MNLQTVHHPSSGQRIGGEGETVGVREADHAPDQLGQEDAQADEEQFPLRSRDAVTGAANTPHLRPFVGHCLHRRLLRLCKGTRLAVGVRDTYAL